MFNVFKGHSKDTQTYVDVFITREKLINFMKLLKIHFREILLNQ